MSRLWPWGVLVVTVLLAHAGSFDGGFVYDDHRFIRVNPALADVTPGRYFTDASTASAGEGIQHDIYRPLRTLFFALQFQVFGLDPTGYHVISVLLHLLAAGLLFRLLQRWCPESVWPPLFGALLFAVHPLTVEVVAWVSSQGDQLAVIFMLLALGQVGRSGTRATVLMAVWFALAILAKESALVLPALVPLAWWLAKRVESAQTGSALPPLSTPRTMWLRVGLLAVLTVLYLVVRFAVLPELAQVPGGWGGPIARLRGMLAGLGWYASQLVWPDGFTFDYQMPLPQRFSDPEVVFGAGLLVSTLLAGAFALRRGWHFVAFVAFGFLACLVPVSNVIVPLKAFVADRFLYPGLICLALLPLAAWKYLPRRIHPALAMAFCAAAVAFIWASSQRAEAWHSEETLWETVRTERPANPNAYQGLAFVYGQEGRVAIAERAFRSYLEANPWDGKARKEFGDLMGTLADSLQLSAKMIERGAATDIQDRRKVAWTAQQRLYMEALRIWSGLGLARGRGSEEMAADLLRRLLRSALLSGEPERARFANDELLRREGIDPSDAEAVMQKASWSRRATRVLSAWNAIRRDAPRDIPAEARATLMRLRRVVLEDIGLSAEASNESLRPRVVGLLQRLVQQRRRSGRPPELFVWGPIIRMHLQAGDLKGARSLLEELGPAYPAEHPDHAWFRNLAAEVLMATRRAARGRGR